MQASAVWTVAVLCLVCWPACLVLGDTHQRSCQLKCKGPLKPVCGLEGRVQKTYKSRCLALCDGAKKLKAGTCSSTKPKVPSPPPPAVNLETLCPFYVSMIEDPICVLKKGATASVQYQNPCIAKALGKVDTSKGDRYFMGQCNTTCDAKCNPLTGKDLKRYTADQGDFICCPPGVEHINACFAACAGGITGASLATCYKGQCVGDRALYLLDNAPCRPGTIIASCLPGKECQAPGANKPTCRADPIATCVDSGSCARFFRLDLLTTICGHHFMAQDGNLVKGCSA